MMRDIGDRMPIEFYSNSMSIHRVPIEVLLMKKGIEFGWSHKEMTSDLC